MSARRVNAPRTSQRGLSLIELMIAMLVGLLLLAGLIQVYLSSKQSYNAQEQLARMQESGRFAMDLITADLRRAGYWGGTVDLIRIDRGSPGAFPPAHECSDNDRWGRMIRWRVSGLHRDSNGYGCAEVYSEVQASDILTVRYAEATPVATMNAGGLYLRENTDSGSVITGSSDLTDLDNQPLSISGDDLLVVNRPLVAHAYYIADSGRTCPGGEMIPELRRVRLNPENGTPTTDSIASGVEQLQVRYLIGNQYRTANEITNPDQWLVVRAVRVWLLIRGECPEPGLVDNATYSMGGGLFPPFTPNDSFRRQLYVSTVMLRNTVVSDPSLEPGLDSDDPDDESGDELDSIEDPPEETLP